MARPWVRVTCLCWNTHVSTTLTPQVWAWIQQRFPRLHVLFLSEVTNLAALRAVLGPAWKIVPATRYRTSSTYVAVRRQRIAAHPRADLADITFRSRWHRVIAALNYDDTRTGRRMSVGSIHVDPLGKGLAHAHPVARRRHIRQVKAWARWARVVARKNPTGVQIMGGDVNEQLSAQLPPRWARQSALTRFRRVGYRAASAVLGQRAQLDDVWLRPTRYARVVSRVQTRPPLRDHDGRPIPGAAGFDHDLVCVSVRVRRAPKP